MKRNKTLFGGLLALLLPLLSPAQDATVSSPDKQLVVSLSVTEGKPLYTVTYKGKTMLEPSPLGLKTNEGDFSAGMKFLGKSESAVDKSYTQQKIKKSQVRYTANKL